MWCPTSWSSVRRKVRNATTRRCFAVRIQSVIFGRPRRDASYRPCSSPHRAWGRAASTSTLTGASPSWSVRPPINRSLAACVRSRLSDASAASSAVTRGQSSPGRRSQTWMTPSLLR